jgi:hypothetical protein
MAARRRRCNPLSARARAARAATLGFVRRTPVFCARTPGERMMDVSVAGLSTTRRGPAQIGERPGAGTAGLPDNGKEFVP